MERQDGAVTFSPHFMERSKAADLNKERKCLQFGMKTPALGWGGGVPPRKEGSKWFMLFHCLDCA